MQWSAHGMDRVAQCEFEPCRDRIPRVRRPHAALVSQRLQADRPLPGHGRVGTRCDGPGAARRRTGRAVGRRQDDPRVDGRGRGVSGPVPRRRPQIAAGLRAVHGRRGQGGARRSDPVARHRLSPRTHTESGDRGGRSPPRNRGAPPGGRALLRPGLHPRGGGDPSGSQAEQRDPGGERAPGHRLRHRPRGRRLRPHPNRRRHRHTRVHVTRTGAVAAPHARLGHLLARLGARHGLHGNQPVRRRIHSGHSEQRGPRRARPHRHAGAAPNDRRPVPGPRSCRPAHPGRTAGTDRTGGADLQSLARRRCGAGGGAAP